MSTIKMLNDTIKALSDDIMVFYATQNPPTASQLNDLEKHLNVAFTEDIREFYLYYGNMIMEVKDSIWKRPAQFDVLPLWKFGYGFYLYGISNDPNMPGWMTLKEKYEENTNKNLGVLLLKRSGNLYRAYFKEGKIYYSYDKHSDELSEFNGNIFDLLIEEGKKLELDLKQYIDENQH